MKFCNTINFASLPHKSSNFSVKVLHNSFLGKTDQAGVNGICREDVIDECELSIQINPPCPPGFDFVLNLVNCPLPIFHSFFPLKIGIPR